MKEEDIKRLPPLSIPYANLRLAKDGEGNIKVFDGLRKKFVSLTPEEYIRQNFVNWLSTHLGYPMSLMANEVEINLNGTKKRCDTVVYDRKCEPLMIIEYKNPEVEITQKTFDQIVRYNREMKAKYLVVANGLKTYCCIIDYDRDSYHFIRTIPTYNEAAGMPGIN